MNEAKTNQLAKKMTELCKRYARYSVLIVPQAFVAIIIGLWRGIGLNEPRERFWHRQD
jgi:hypothetical protein